MAKPAKPSADVHQCSKCLKVFRHKFREGEERPVWWPVCGATICQAKATWTDTEWAGQARMAEARQAAGRDLDDLDHLAIIRGKP